MKLAKLNVKVYKYFKQLSTNDIIILFNKIYYFDQKVPGIHSENSKYKFYSSKVILSSSKYSPSTATHLCQRLIQLSKHFWNSIVGIAVFDFPFDFSHYLLSAIKTRSP